MNKKEGEELMKSSFEEEIINLLTPKIKSVLRQTTYQNQGDLEQELILLMLSKIDAGHFSQAPSFFELVKEKPCTVNDSISS